MGNCTMHCKKTAKQDKDYTFLGDVSEKYSHKISEARMGFEPMIKDLQSSALDQLCYPAIWLIGNGLL